MLSDEPEFPDSSDFFTCIRGIQTAPPRGASGKWYFMSPHGALRAYTVFPTAEPRRGSPMAYLLQHRTLSDWSDLSERSDSPSEVRVGRVVFCHRMAQCVLIRCFPQPSLAEAPSWCYLIE